LIASDEIMERLNAPNNKPENARPERGTFAEFARGAWPLWLKRKNKPLSPSTLSSYHIFQHSAGSILDRKTGDVKLVQEVLGHSRISATADIYVHVEPTVVEYATGLLASEVIGDTVVTQESELVN